MKLNKPGILAGKSDSNKLNELINCIELALKHKLIKLSNDLNSAKSSMLITMMHSIIYYVYMYSIADTPGQMPGNIGQKKINKR